MQTVTFINEKGGVGKTTSTTTIAAGFAALRGKKVLVVDADAQGTLTMACGYQPYPGLYETTVRNAPVANWLKPVSMDQLVNADDPDRVSGGQLFILGGNRETHNIPNMVSDAMTLKNALRAVEDYFDYCFIDTSPTPSMFHSAVYMQTDALIHPTMLEAFSVSGLMSTMETRRNLAAQRNQMGFSPVHRAGIIPLRVKLRTLENAELLDEIRSKTDEPIWTPVPDSIIWAEAGGRNMSIWAYAPESKAAAYGKNMVAEAERYLNAS